MGAAPPGPDRGSRSEDPQTRIEREEFARGHLPEGAAPAAPRPAATTVVARPAGSQFEVLLLQRPGTSRFAAGAYVFPGGVVEEDDASDQWVGRLPISRERIACAAGLRELFEETGILPAPPADPSPERLERARHQLLAGTRPFTDLVAEFSLDFSRAALAYFSRWITPRAFLRRYDTRFFFLKLSDDAVDVTLTDEHDAWLWERPGPALERSRTGDLPMLFPTRKTLEQLSAFASIEQAFASFKDVSVEPMLVKLERTGEQLRPLMPGDDGYEETS